MKQIKSKFKFQLVNIVQKRESIETKRSHRYTVHGDVKNLDNHVSQSEYTLEYI